MVEKMGQKVELNDFIEHLFEFISDISPLVNKMNQSISEAIQPAANVSDNISKVSEANEMATIDIMNLLDDTSAKSSEAMSSLQNLNDSFIESRKDFLIDLLGILRKKDIKTAEKIVIKEMANLSDGAQSREIKEIEDAFNTTIMNAQEIMMALQVQDITTQQLAAIDSTVRTIQSKIQGIIKMTSSLDTSGGVSATADLNAISDNISQLHRQVVFDPKAINQLSSGENNQAEVDDLLNSFNAGADTTENKKEEDSAANEEISADDIDNLFAGNNGKKDTPKKEEEGKETPEDSGESISQDDIDALFGKK